MTRNTSVTLGEHFERFIEEQIAQGRFETADEVVRAGLRLLEDEEAGLRALRDALLEGERSGPPASLDWDDFLSHKRAEHASR